MLIIPVLLINGYLQLEKYVINFCVYNYASFNSQIQAYRYHALTLSVITVLCLAITIIFVKEQKGFSSTYLLTHSLIADSQVKQSARKESRFLKVSSSYLVSIHSAY